MTPTTVVWQGPSGGNWSTPANWSAPLVAGDDLLFPAVSSAHITNDDIAGFAANSISIESGSTAGYTFNTVGGVTLTLGSGLSSPFISDQSGASDMINMSIAIPGGPKPWRSRAGRP